MRLASISLHALKALWVCALTSGLANAQMLAPQDAFRASLRQSAPTTVELEYKIASGYVLYKERFRFELNGSPLKRIEYLETKADRVLVKLQLNSTAKKGDLLAATSQGCSTTYDVCFPPMKTEFSLNTH